MAEPTPTPSPGPAVAFAEWLPALGGSRLLRVHGGAPTPEPPTLVLTLAGAEHRIEPRSQSRFTRPGEWRASYLIAAEHAHAGSTVPALEWPDGTRLTLPEPPSQPRAEVIEPSVLTSLRARRAGGTPEPATPQTPVPVPVPAEATIPAPDPPASSPAWTDLPAAFSRTVFEPGAAWTAKRAELERELGRAAQAITRAQTGERESRDAMIAALADVRADLRAARASREADAGVIAILTAELEAERIAHAVTRQTAAALRAALAEARAAASGDAHAAPSPPEERSLMARVDALTRTSGREGLERAARDQAAALASRRPVQETGALLANLDAAASALRRRVEPAATPLRRVLVELAEQDPATAAEILVALLPAQGAALNEPLAYDLTIAGAGTYAVTVADGVADVQRVSKRRSRRKAAFELRADALTLAKLLAGDELKLRRYRGDARVTRRRRRARALQALPASPLTLAGAVAAGAKLEPGLVYRALPYAIAPEWTAGRTFTIAQEISGSPSRTWYVVVADGARIEVTHEPRPADATVTMTRDAFDRLLRDEPPAADERPLVNGDRAAVALLKEWTDRARGLSA